VRYQVSNLLKKEKGFTLIEIVLVLAIAGLLLVIVFLAVSGAQKSRRDTQRKNDNARLLAQVVRMG
jgi:prepilin-type N-terminal cleavage/methylation domain-containing protein